MSDFNMYGPEASPTRLIENDEAQNFQRIAAAQHSQALTQKTMEELGRAKKIRDAFQGQNYDPNAPASQRIFTDASRLSQLGYPQEAAKMLTEGTLAASREAMTSAHQAQGALAKAKGFDEIAQAQARNYQGVTDQKTFDLANAVWSHQTGQPSPFIGMQYTPQLKDYIISQGLNAKDVALMDYEKGKAKEAVSAEKSLTDLRNARAEAARAQAELSRTRGDKLEKVGGPGAKDIGMPPKDATKLAMRAILDVEPELVNDSVRRLADVITGEAQEIKKTQRDLTWDKAIQRALEAHKSEILTDAIPEKGGMAQVQRAVGIGGTKPVRVYRPTVAGGGTDIPEIATKGSAYKPGKSYRFPDGRVGVYTGRDADGKLLIEWR
jgi:hypothetical protein